jgi:hypothetical protein
MVRQQMTVHPSAVPVITNMVKANPPSANTWLLAVDRHKYTDANTLIDPNTEEGWPTMYIIMCDNAPLSLYYFFPTENSQRSVVCDLSVDINSLTIDE